MAKVKTGKTAKKKFKKSVRKSVPVGVVHIQATFNNTIVTISDPNGNVIAWSSAGSLGFRGSQKGTPFAAQQASATAAKAAREHGLRTEGHGSGIRPRVGRARAGDRGSRCQAHSGRDADSPQWLPAAQTEARLIAAEPAAPLEGGAAIREI